MAQLNSRGTLTRGRWDFFERSNGVAFVYGSVGAGPIGAYFANNATSGAAIDIYAIHGSSNNAVNWDTFILLPPIAGEPFFTLPPLWGIAILSPGAPGADELSLTVWYQEVLDNIAPAR